MGFRAVKALHGRVVRDERGIGMIEVVASAAILAIVAVGLLTGFDAAGNASGTNKARAVAASIAQDDQERMRGLEVRTLVLRGPEVRTVKAGPATYTVKSTAEPVSDSGAQGCTAGSTGVDYLRLKSEVTWNGMRIDPVTSDSLMAPRVGSFGVGEGGMSVRIVDRDAKPRTGVSVALAGAQSFNDTTDVDGCAFFAYVPSGDYQVRFSTAGMVTPGGVQDVDEPVSVPVGAVANKVFQYDQAAQVKANFQTINSSSVTVADVGTDLAVAHPNVPAPGVRAFSSETPMASMATGFTLFPFTSAYSVYAGSCLGANPTKFGQTVPTVILGRAANASVNVLEPSINVTVTLNTKATSGAKVRFYGVTCPDVFTSPDLTDANGRLPKPGMPYGDYEACAQYPASGTEASIRHVDLTNVKNQKPGGTSITFAIDNSGGGQSPTGSCSTE